MLITPTTKTRKRAESRRLAQVAAACAVAAMTVLVTGCGPESKAPDHLPKAAAKPTATATEHVSATPDMSDEKVYMPTVNPGVVTKFGPEVTTTIADEMQDFTALTLANTSVQQGTLTPAEVLPTLHVSPGVVAEFKHNLPALVVEQFSDSDTNVPAPVVSVPDVKTTTWVLPNGDDAVRADWTGYARVKFYDHGVLMRADVHRTYSAILIPSNEKQFNWRVQNVKTGALVTPPAVKVG